MSHHYAIVAGKLAEQCLEKIQDVIDSDERSKRLHPSNSSLYDMKVALAEIELHLFHYFGCIIEKEVENSSSSKVHEIYKTNDPCTELRSCVEFLQFVVQESSLAAAEHAGHPAHSYYPRRSATDSLLFRLNVALQLCLVRIDDARLVICGERYKESTCVGTSTAIQPSNRPYFYFICTGLFGATTLATWCRQRNPELQTTRNFQMYQPFIQNSSKFVLVIVAFRWLHQKWSNVWMTTKLVKSTDEMEQWIRQWVLVQSTPAPKPQQPQNKIVPLLPPQIDKNHDNLLDAARSRRLIEYALHETAKVRTICLVLILWSLCFHH
jgi:hypothetical protein